MSLSKSVLIIDDEALIQELIMMEMEDHGFCCHLASDTKKAREILNTHNIDLIITDAMMPGESGIEFIKRQNQVEGFNTPIILMSGFTGLSSEEAKDLNVAAIINKPFHSQDIVEIIKKIIS